MVRRKSRKLVTFGAVLLIIIVGFAVVVRKGHVKEIFDGSKTAGLKLVPGEQVDNQGCSGKGQVEFGTSPMDSKDVGLFSPLGLMTGAHVTPIDHMYFYPIDVRSARDTYAVRAMADGLITTISERKQQVNDINNGAPKPAEYQMKFWYTCDFASYYDLLTSLSPRLQAEFDAHKRSGGYAQVQVKVKEGEVVGRIGGQTLDFAVYDYTKQLSGFIVPEHYLVESWKLHVVNAFPYFKEPIRSQLLALDPRQAEPREGKIDYDQDGKLVGTWFKEGNGGFGMTNGKDPAPWRAHLSFVYDAIDPSLAVLSIGDYGGQAQQFAVIGNAPDPATIGVGDLHKYELTQIDHYRSSTGQPWSDNTHAFDDIKARPGSYVQGTVLAQLVGTRKLKFEAFPGKPAAQVTGFDASAITYER